MEPNSIYSPEGSIPFKRYFHGTQIKIKSSKNQKKETKKKIPQKEAKQTLNGPTLSKKKRRKKKMKKRA